MVDRHGVVRPCDHGHVCAGGGRSFGHRDNAAEILDDPLGVEQVSRSVVDDRLRDRADRCRAACAHDVEPERRELIGGCRGLTGCPRPVHDRDHDRAGRDRRARWSLQPKEIVDGLLVLRIGRQHDRSVVVALVHVVREVLYVRHGELRNRRDIGRTEGPQEIDHVAERQLRVDLEVRGDST